MCYILCPETSFVSQSTNFDGTLYGRSTLKVLGRSISYSSCVTRIYMKVKSKNVIFREAFGRTRFVVRKFGTAFKIVTYGSLKDNP
jgi:hypothetical protein